MWTNDAQIKDLPYLGGLISAVIFEVIGVVILFVKKGLKYLPEVEINKEEGETLEFMKRFIKSGSSVTIVSNRLAWLRKSAPIKDAIIQMAKDGTSLEIITPSEVADDIKKPLVDAGVIFYVTKEKVPPDARFTLVDGSRSGAEKLAIARGSHPEHEITIFDNNSGPQIIAMAKDIIRKSKELSRAA
ncbi:MULTISPECIES: hypothetical protein [Nitrosomonas]|uniref:hypothetical protein n=1 Tax=Nitrosomonas TaxID=914 RepID=UPI00190FE9C8|nr:MULTISPECIES: hypothetical protein [Nitrosomonas]UVS60214.1 hypothetical protein NX761_11885 [Nitrosomonas sp. PLL12]